LPDAPLSSVEAAFSCGDPQLRHPRVRAQSPHDVHHRQAV